MSSIVLRWIPQVNLGIGANEVGVMLDGGTWDLTTEIEDEARLSQLESIITANNERLIATITKLAGLPNELSEKLIKPVTNFGITRFVNEVSGQHENLVRITKNFDDALDTLGVTKDEIPENLAHAPASEIFRQAQARKELNDMFKEGKADYATLLELAHRASKPKKNTRRQDAYDRAFSRVYIEKTHTRKEAFSLMLREEGLKLSVIECYGKFEAFEQALKRRKADEVF